MYTLAHKRQVIPPTPPIVNPTILRISNGPATIDSSRYIPINADYTKEGEYNYSNEFNLNEHYEELGIHSYIAKYTMLDFLINFSYSITEGGIDHITNIYIDNVLHSELNNNTSIYVLENNIGETGIPYNYIYYKIGDNPVGIYTKNNLAFDFVDVDEFERQLNMQDELIEYDNYNEFTNEFGKTFTQLPSTITVTVVQ